MDDLIRIVEAEAALDRHILALPQELIDKLHWWTIALRLPKRIFYEIEFEQQRRPQTMFFEEEQPSSWIAPSYIPPPELAFDPVTRSIAAEQYYSGYTFVFKEPRWCSLPKFLASLPKKHRLLLKDIRLTALPPRDPDSSSSRWPPWDPPLREEEPLATARQSWRAHLFQAESALKEAGLDLKPGVVRILAPVDEWDDIEYGPFEYEVCDWSPMYWLSEEDFMRMDGPMTVPPDTLFGPGMFLHDAENELPGYQSPPHSPRFSVGDMYAWPNDSELDPEPWTRHGISEEQWHDPSPIDRSNDPFYDPDLPRDV